MKKQKNQNKAIQIRIKAFLVMTGCIWTIRSRIGDYLKALAEAQHYLLIQYDNLIHTVSEGLEYVEKQICDGGSFRTPVVFQDILDAFIQMNHTHEQIADIFNEEGMHLLLEEFSRMIIHLQAWFDEDTEEGKYFSFVPGSFQVMKLGNWTFSGICIHMSAINREKQVRPLLSKGAFLSSPLIEETPSSTRCLYFST